MTLYFIDQDVQKYGRRKEKLTYKGVSVKGKGGMMKSPDYFPGLHLLFVSR